jgi:hypothetical protein
VQNRPYKAFFAGGDWVCSIARYTGTMTGPMIGPDGTEIPPTGKSFDVDFCTVGHWKNGQMVEEYLLRRRDLHAADRTRRIDRTQARSTGHAARTHTDRGPGVSEHGGCAPGPLNLATLVHPEAPAGRRRKLAGQPRRCIPTCPPGTTGG